MLQKLLCVGGVLLDSYETTSHSPGVPSCTSRSLCEALKRPDYSWSSRRLAARWFETSLLPDLPSLSEAMLGAFRAFLQALTGLRHAMPGLH